MKQILYDTVKPDYGHQSFKHKQCPVVQFSQIPQSQFNYTLTRALQLLLGIVLVSLVVKLSPTGLDLD